MIVDLFLQAVVGVFTLILSAIPDGQLPETAATALSSFATTIGGALGGLDSVVPVTEAATFIGWTLGTYVPIAVAYQVSLWVYEHLPVIGNGG